MVAAVSGVGRAMEPRVCMNLARQTSGHASRDLLHRVVNQLLG
ncbi:hypothetical protein C7S14_4886 [Burkholderia cepacia]|nr:hypothetical protein C7S14_4886 [Burkholderia cepacia]